MATTSLVRSHASFHRLTSKFVCGVKSRRNQLCQCFFLKTGLRVLELQEPKMAFPIDNVNQSYNSVSTTMLHCDYVHILLRVRARVCL